MIHGYVLVKAEPDRKEAVLRGLRSAFGPLAVAQTDGAYDAIILVGSDDLCTLGRLLDREVFGLDGVRLALLCPSPEGGLAAAEDRAVGTAHLEQAS